MQLGGATTCLCIGWARNWTVWEYSWRLVVEMQHTVCCNVPICWIFWKLVSSLGSDEPCRDQVWELNCLVYITSKVHVMLFLLCIWCQYCYSSLSSSCVCAVCNWCLKMTVKCPWVVLWNWGRVLLIQIGICARQTFVMSRGELIVSLSNISTVKACAHAHNFVCSATKGGRDSRSSALRRGWSASQLAQLVCSASFCQTTLFKNCCSPPFL